MYVVVNKDLGMSAGKTAAQVAHAVARMDVGVPRTMIVLQATTEQLHNLDTYLTRANLPHHLYIDEGVNEVDPMSATALAFGKCVESFTPDFIKGFELYKAAVNYDGFNPGLFLGVFLGLWIGGLLWVLSQMIL